MYLYTPGVCIMFGALREINTFEIRIESLRFYAPNYVIRFTGTFCTKYSFDN